MTTCRPMLMSKPMVRASTHPTDPKTMTRRIVRFKTDWSRPAGTDYAVVKGTDDYDASWSWPEFPDFPPIVVRNPYGKPGDELLLLSSWATLPAYDHLRPKLLPADAPIWTRWQEQDGDDDKPSDMGKLRPGRFLPRELRHHMPRVEIVSVKVERLHSISYADLKAEGMRALDDDNRDKWDSCAPRGETHWPSLREYYEQLWNDLNYKRGYGFDVNPWVWCIGYQRVTL